MTRENEGALEQIRRSIGLIRAPGSTVAACYHEWMKDIVAAARGISFSCTSIEGSIVNLTRALLPQVTPPTKTLFVPSRGEWTALFENSQLGADAGHIRMLAEKLTTVSMRVVSTMELREPVGDLIWELNGPEGARRALHVSVDGRRREFGSYGTPMAFEDQERYALRSVRHRFDIAMLKSYLAELQAFPFDNDWFLDSGAFLVERHGGYLRVAPGSTVLH